MSVAFLQVRVVLLIVFLKNVPIFIINSVNSYFLFVDKSSESIHS